ncbi:hypothetical protein DLAC_08910 [Tieghemostelium lacteum]|uniref:Ubiquitin-like domain-containing protein n=1 Tax=Tieghemostelium lacteum TaxID=361077 RepID=A0A151Z8Q5_TIELA|nr:hypothetical protein DLAC_08910 [Tieghemostelium lacteum]|eukprot:KYQ90308.1 hypothetical protein DLAC_08910 [Tieghemostelium lacteum]
MSKELNINIKKLDGTSFSLTVTGETTVLELKGKILEVSGVTLPLQRIIFKGKVLRDDKNLAFYNIEDGNTLHLAERAPESQNPVEAPQQNPPPPLNTGNQNNANRPRVIRVGGGQVGDDLQNLLRSITGGQIPTQTHVTTASVNMGQQIRHSFAHLNNPNNNNIPPPNQPQNPDPNLQSPPPSRLLDYLEISSREIQILVDRTRDFQNQVRNQNNITDQQQRQQLQDQITTLATRYQRLSQASGLLSQGLSAFRFGATPQEAEFVPTTVSGISQISLQFVADGGQPQANQPQQQPQQPQQQQNQAPTGANIFSNLNLGNDFNPNALGGIIQGILGGLQRPQQQVPQGQQNQQQPQVQQQNFVNNNMGGLPDLLSMLPQLTSMLGATMDTSEDSPLGGFFSQLPRLLGDVRGIFSENAQTRVDGHTGFRNVFIQECLENNTSQENIDLFVQQFIDASIRPYVTSTLMPPELQARLIQGSNLNNLVCRVLEQHIRSLISIVLTPPSLQYNIGTHIREWIQSFFTDIVDSIKSCFQNGTTSDAQIVIQNFLQSRAAAINPLFVPFTSILTNHLITSYNRTHQNTTTTTNTTQPQRPTTTTTTTTSSNSNNSNNNNSIIPQEWRETIEIDEARQESAPPSKPLSSLYTKGYKKPQNNNNNNTKSETTTTTTTTTSTPTGQSRVFLNILDQALQNSNVNNNSTDELLNSEEVNELTKLYQQLLDKESKK